MLQGHVGNKLKQKWNETDLVCKTGKVMIQIMHLQHMMFTKPAKTQCKWVQKFKNLFLNICWHAWRWTGEPTISMCWIQWIASRNCELRWCDTRWSIFRTCRICLKQNHVEIIMLQAQNMHEADEPFWKNVIVCWKFVNCMLIWCTSTCRQPCTWVKSEVHSLLEQLVLDVALLWLQHQCFGHNSWMSTMVYH